MSNEQISPLVLDLADQAATLEMVGGKGESLARLAGAGLPVPPGFHITTAAYREFVAANGLQEQILAAVSAASPDQPATFEEESSRITRLFSAGSMPDEIAGTIRQAYAKLGEHDPAVAVRSSATAEDLPEMSFAGQQETYLNMRGNEQVLDAVKRCWASLWTARAMSYRAQHHIAPEEVSLAVVVQELVPADAAGILFTANPLTGEREQAMLNASWGLGEAIVGGQVTPDSFVVDKASGKIVEQEINEKEVMTVRTGQGTHEEPVSSERRKLPALTPEQAAELVHLGVQIEELYGRPMDIEWALQGDRCFIVQARPITALPEPTSAAASPQTEAWKLPDPKGRYVRASLLELLPDPLSPLFATLGLPAYDRALQSIAVEANLTYLFANEPFNVINGYGYYDVTYTLAQSARLLLDLPRILSVTFPRLFRTAERRWQAARTNYTELVRLWQAFDLASTPASQLLAGVQDIVEKGATYYLSVQSGILPEAYMSELFFTIAYNRLLKRRDDPPALTFLLGYDSAPIQAEKSLYDLAQWVREQPALAGKLAAMSHSEFDTACSNPTNPEEPLAGMDQEAWAEFCRRFAVHLERFGDVIYDLDFAKPLPADDPAALLETLKFFLSGQATDPYKRQQTAAAAREAAAQRLISRLRGRRLAIFRKLLGWAQHYAPLREDALAGVGLGWPVLRRMLHEIDQRLSRAGALASADDVFWLTLDELRTATSALDSDQSVTDYRAVVAERQASWERAKAMTPPAALPIKTGARFLGIDFSKVMPARLDQPEGDVLKGIAASPGQVTATARVIAGPSEFGQMRQGDILVARITTPAWTPLFALASGVVTDVGGPLSHSSIVAREYHIPAVLGTGVATERLHSGQRVTVDGSAGTVTGLSE